MRDTPKPSALDNIIDESEFPKERVLSVAARAELQSLRQRVSDLEELAGCADLMGLITEVRLARMSPDGWIQMAERIRKRLVYLSTDAARAALLAARSKP